MLFGLPESSDDPRCGQSPSLFIQFYRDFVDRSPEVRAAKERILTGAAWEELSQRFLAAFPPFPGGSDLGASYKLQFVEELFWFWAWYANTHGIEAADEKARTAILDTEWKGRLFTIVYGVQAQSEIQLTENERLIPVSKLPRHSLFREFRGVFSSHGPVASAIVSEAPLEWYLPADRKVTNALTVVHRACFLGLIVTCASAVSMGNKAVLPQEYDAPGIFSRGASTKPLLRPMVSGTWAFPIEEVDPEFERIADAIQRALSSPKDQNLIRAIERLGKAKDGIHNVDRALDLGIALEMILLSDSHGGSEKPDQLSLSFRLRGAKFLGGEKHERLANAKILKGIYDLRSQGAHTGKLKDESLLGPQMFEIATRIFRKTLLEGKPRDWNEFLV